MDGHRGPAVRSFGRAVRNCRTGSRTGCSNFWTCYAKGPTLRINGAKLRTALQSFGQVIRTGCPKRRTGRREKGPETPEWSSDASGGRVIWPETLGGPSDDLVGLSEAPKHGTSDGPPVTPHGFGLPARSFGQLLRTVRPKHLSLEWPSNVSDRFGRPAPSFRRHPKFRSVCPMLRTALSEAWGRDGFGRPNLRTGSAEVSTRARTFRTASHFLSEVSDSRSGQTRRICDLQEVVEQRQNY